MTSDDVLLRISKAFPEATTVRMGTTDYYNALTNVASACDEILHQGRDESGLTTQGTPAYTVTRFLGADFSFTAYAAWGESSCAFVLLFAGHYTMVIKNEY